jgi:hypothetical protein
LPKITNKGFIYAVAILYKMLEPIGESENFLQDVVKVFSGYNLEKIRML